jgi:uncharacterized protein YrzB (UPF0473 family)
MMEEEKDNVIVLVDESGKEIEFQYLMTVDHNDEEYVCLIPADGSASTEEGDQVVIMKLIRSKDGEEQLVNIEDEDEYEAVFDRLQEMLDEEECGECECDCGSCGTGNGQEEEKK